MCVWPSTVGFPCQHPSEASGEEKGRGRRCCCRAQWTWDGAYLGQPGRGHLWGSRVVGETMLGPLPMGLTLANKPEQDSTEISQGLVVFPSLSEF